MARIETPRRVRGTQDIFGDEQRRFARVVEAFEHVRRLYCFQQVQVPVFHFQLVQPAADDAGLVVAQGHGLFTFVK